MIESIRRRDILTIGGSLLLASGLPFDAGRAESVERSAIGNVEPWSSNSPFLNRAFAPVFDERDDADLTVEGTIPKGLHGVFMRVGPNPLYPPDDRYVYPFDGTGMIHAIYLEGGRARYKNRWVATDEAMKERAAGHRLYNSSFSPPPHADLANTNIIHHAGRYLVLYEDGVPYEVDGDLNTKGLFNYDGKLPTVMSAHPKFDHRTGELLSLAYNPRTGELWYLRANKTGHLDRILAFHMPWPTIIHDVSITDKHLVAFMGPAVFDRTKPGPPVTWQPERGSVVAIVPRGAQSPDEVKWIKGAPFFQFHTMNAFEEGNRIEVTVPWYDSFSLTKPSTRLELHRLVLDTQKGTVADEIIDDRPCEFPRINDAYLGRRARYGYVGFRDPRPGETQQTGAFEAIARYDLTSGSRVVCRLPAGVTICEPLFVPDPQGKAEVDGFIFTFVHDAASPRGIFMILDARQLDAKPVAIVHLPRRIPAGLHSSWTPA